MAIQFDGGTLIVGRNPTGLGGNYDVFSVCFWAYISVDTNDSACMIRSQGNLQLGSDGTELGYYHATPGYQTGSSQLSTATWYHIGLVRNGSSKTQIFLDGVSNFSATAQATENSWWNIGSYDIGAYGFNGRMERLRVWSDAAMVASDFLGEKNSATVVRTSNLFWNTPLISDLNDISGNGRHLSILNGSASWAAGPEFGAAGAPGSIYSTVTL